MSTVWVVAALSYVVVVPLSFFLVVAVGSRVGYDHRREHDRWLYAGFSALFATVLVGAGPVSPTLAFEPLWLLALPAGAALYAVDTAVWQRWTGARVDRGTGAFVWTVPMLLSVVPEELVFRTALAPLVDSLGGPVFVAVSAVAFGLAHVANGRHEVAFKSWNGVVYALAFLATGSVVVPVLAHVGYNLVAVWVISLTGTDAASR